MYFFAVADEKIDANLQKAANLYDIGYQFQ